VLEGRAEERAVERQEAVSRALAREVGVLWSSSRCDRPRRSPPARPCLGTQAEPTLLLRRLSLPHALRFRLPSSRETGPEILHFVLTFCFAP